MGNCGIVPVLPRVLTMCREPAEILLEDLKVKVFIRFLVPMRLSSKRLWILCSWNLGSEDVDMKLFTVQLMKWNGDCWSGMIAELPSLAECGSVKTRAGMDSFWQTVAWFP